MTSQRWHESDEFWTAVTSRLFPPERLEAAESEVDAILRLADADPGAEVLDMACGVGRHCLALARRGFHVTAVDRTECYLRQAQEAAAGEDLQVEWVLNDMRRFRREGAFDVALNLFSSFGYFEDPADDRLVAENFLASLRPGGVLIMEMMGKEVLARIFRPRHWSEGADGELWLDEAIIRPGWDWIDNTWILIKEDVRQEFSVGHRLYSAAELRHLLLECGFASAEAYGNLDGAPYDHSAQRLIMVARKSV